MTILVSGANRQGMVLILYTNQPSRTLPPFNSSKTVALLAVHAACSPVNSLYQQRLYLTPGFGWFRTYFFF